ncbi:hypothetical protein KZ483_21785 [Paenibacillus sp. sptzw28]|uniref:hypothetical protein n=1 Tax=Paenibacillus sp. sptzw28 TaxID=715179 RepID=UPI001C6F4487|nr:hypothetical protein [Paenibacillus sp. sptzw28]QYR20422.1 hypothetical protein KZ483_21785 [Paenibacillus sp. sptzw28]
MKEAQSRTIIIDHFGRQPHETSPEAMASLAGGTFVLSERVADAAGEAFDFAAWYEEWRNGQGITDDVPQPTHLKVEAADAFEALIPWEQLPDAAVQFAINGSPLTKGGPIRLYVPNGTSACLNVKSVVVCRILHEEASRGDVAYGFKNTFSPQDMRMKR